MQLEDKYTIDGGRVYLTGIQALVRLPMEQVRRDRRAGLRTGAFISGYSGSPLGNYDLSLQRVGRLLRTHSVHFVPGINEEVAATSVFGSQIVEIAGGAKLDGVVGIWYGKGPGVDRTGDVFRHANLAGTGRNCAALVLGGDDHIAKSSTIPHQSDFSFYNVGMPVFYPGNAQEILDYGLLAIALSRFSGAWCAMKMVTNVCDGGGMAETDPERLSLRLPEGYEKVFDARLVVPYTLMLEHEMVNRRLAAARDFARINRVNRWDGARSDAWLGIASAGKPYHDLRQALRDLSLNEDDLKRLGIRIAQFGMTFPLEPAFVREFAAGLETILVVEEKRSFLELQLRELLYEDARHPRIVGKFDSNGEPLLAATGELTPEDLSAALARVLAGRSLPVGFDARLQRIAAIDNRVYEQLPSRSPNFCSGCPHNRSTILLDGQFAGGGIGCHAMSQMLGHTGRGYSFLTQMGGEGAPWIGMSPFVERSHMFQNVGDGTYFHSGTMSLNACVAAGVNITFKILYNGAVAMTGGQVASGALPIPDLTRRLAAEGVKRSLVLTDDLAKYASVTLAANAELRGRDDLADAMRELEKVDGVTVIIYDQQCAAEKRRLRSRGKLEEPARRLVIHEEVCEGCGDCVRKSNCMSLYPVETEYGQKTRIHQSSCNKDYSCALGDCPSFVTVNLKPGTGLKKRVIDPGAAGPIAEPRGKAKAGEYYAILSPGIGGTGVVTVNALLATSAWLDGVSAITLDQTGLAQKGGAVVSSIILSERPIEAAARIGYGNADLILGFDLVGAGAPENLKCAEPSRTVAVINTSEVPTGEVIRGEIPLAGPRRVMALVNQSTDRGRNVIVDASRIAESLFGSHLAVNVFLLGVAYQAGLIPLDGTSIEEAIRLNKAEVERNIEAFRWGRRYYLDAGAVEALIAPAKKAADPRPMADRRYDDLVEYQGVRYADEYRAFVREVAASAPAMEEPVARYLYKLMAYKDEYEVARLLSKPSFRRELDDQWEQIQSIEWNLHPPFLRALGFRNKIQMGAWSLPLLRMLARLRFLRGTPFDLFGLQPSRREERELVAWYRDLIRRLLREFNASNQAEAVHIACLPDRIRGYEQVKQASIREVKAEAESRAAALSSAISVLQ
ncbi:MAG: indolepyruvate ferredoxin oxidoreductase family protein [Bryobacteraceae bacterium]